MSNGNLNVDSSALSSVGNSFTQVANEVREIFTQMNSTVDQVTANNSWSGDASRTFLDKFNNIKPRLEMHLQQLEDLGPAVNKTSNTYADAEADNVSRMA